MELVQSGSSIAATSAKPRIRWPAIIAGAVAASALSFVLLSFASALGLSIASTASTWRDASLSLWILSGVYLVFVALASFGLGGYIAGRMHTAADVATIEDVEFGDGLHGLVTWGLAILIGAVLALATANAFVLSGPGNTALASSSAGEGLLADELDQLFRSDHRLADADLSYRRAEASRILLTVSGHNGLTNEDRDYLGAMVANHTGISQPAADQRVSAAVARAKRSIARARASSAIEAFALAAALLLGAVAAWFAAVEGGRDRERSARPVWTWTPWRHV